MIPSPNAANLTQAIPPQPTSGSPWAGWWLKVSSNADSPEPFVAPCQTLAGAWELLVLDDPRDEEWEGATIRLVGGYPADFPGIVVARVDRHGGIHTADGSTSGAGTSEWRMTGEQWAERLGLTSISGVQTNARMAEERWSEALDLANVALELRAVGREDLAQSLCSLLVRSSQSEALPVPPAVLAMSSPGEPSPAQPLEVSAQVVGGRYIRVADVRGREVCMVTSGYELALLLDYHQTPPTGASPGWQPWSLNNSGSFDLPPVRRDYLNLLSDREASCTFSELVHSPRRPGEIAGEMLANVVQSERQAVAYVRAAGHQRPTAGDAVQTPDFSEYSVLIATDPQYWHRQGHEASIVEAFRQADSLAAAARAAHPGLKCHLLGGNVDKHDQSSGPDAQVREQLEAWVNTHMGIMLEPAALPVPDQLSYWRVDEVIECLSFGGDLGMVEAALIAAMPNAYGEREEGRERETPPEPDADQQFKLSAVWTKLPDEVKAAICTAAAAQYPGQSPNHSEADEEPAIPSGRRGRGR